MQTLISEDQLQQRVAALAREISSDHPNGVHMVCVLKGAFMFLADLVRTMTCEVTLDFMAVSSYGLATRSSGQVRVLKDLDSGLEGRSVIIVEDIVDTGLTLAYLQDILRARGPRTPQDRVSPEQAVATTDRRRRGLRRLRDRRRVRGRIRAGLRGASPQPPLPRRRQRLVAGGFTAARTFSIHVRASAMTAASSSVSTLRSRISTRPFTTVFRTSSPWMT